MKTKSIILICLFTSSVFAAPPTPLTPKNATPWIEVIGNLDAVKTQGTSISTGVTLNAQSGVITTVSSTLAAVTTTGFTVTNSAVGANSVVIVNLVNYSGTYATNGFPVVTVDTIAAGSFVIKISNVHAANALSGVLKIGFHVL